jgi:DNA-binding Xre family transcriptional regulator
MFADHETPSRRSLDDGTQQASAVAAGESRADLSFGTPGLRLAAARAFVHLAEALVKRVRRPPRLAKALLVHDVRASTAVRVAQLRRERKLTQTELARRLKTTQQMVSDIETYKHSNVTLGTLQKIARALRTSLVVDLR